ncbi:FHA domain-containing protein [Solwaraspora sp. WMMD406]|uniref:FHA domain-containing protein n=1 Tax=Solwaraspora sp. WMMD406 TaxID=3016095 RepID=UPI00241756DE|nr:FHA domain-containing protein [Solwaraspora sp. WMMD406]MDG4767587.1 FHA domain-containing protein [Solwaraspora sp. WMMD406]
MRFEVSKVLDAIERRLSTDPATARAVVDLAEVVRYVDFDNGRPANMLRLGQLVDALGREVAEENVPVYVVVHRGLLSDADLTSNERMVARRWADDGLVEVLANPADRLLEVAELLGLPVLSRNRFEGLRGRYQWLGQPGRLLAPLPGHGGPALVARAGGGSMPTTADPSPAGAQLLARLWHCPDPDCALFGQMRVGRPGGQPPPTLRTGQPTCPRHEERLTETGPRPPAEVLSIRIDGVIRQRFVVSADHPMVVGRAPEGGKGIMLGQWLSEEARRWISRSHVRFELHGKDLVVQDVSTNGTGVRPGGSPDDDERRTIKRQARPLHATDVVELYPGVHIGRSRIWATGGVTNPTSVMADAPTMSMRTLERP